MDFISLAPLLTWITFQQPRGYYISDSNEDDNAEKKEALKLART